MDYDEIFAIYYPLYRGQATVPASTDREYRLGIPLANAAIMVWDRTDGILWRELFTTAQVDATATLTVDTGATSYNGPTNMRKPGGIVKLSDPSNASNYVELGVIDPNDLYAKSKTGSYAYFVGGANTGWQLYLHGNMTSYNGWDIDYPYYKKATKITSGSSIPDMSDPNYIVYKMLQSRFVNSRNGFAYSDAKTQAETILANMVVEQNSGSDSNSWNLLNNDTTPGFGDTGKHGSFFRGY